jgi:hypothetical protein
MHADWKLEMTLSTDADRLAFIVAAKQSFRAAQRLRTWEQRVAAIARMNAARIHTKQSRLG